MIELEEKDYKTIINKLKEQKEKIKELEEVNKSMTKYFTHQQILLEVYSRLNAPTNNYDENIQLTLQYLTGMFDSDAFILYRKNTANEYKVINSSIFDYNIRSNSLSSFVEDFNINKQFPYFMRQLQSSLPVHIENAQELNDICNIYNVNKLDLIPFDIADKQEGILLAINAKKNQDTLKYLPTYFASSIDKVIKDKLLYELSITDTSTGLFNRNYYNKTLQNIKKEKLDALGIVYFDLNKLKFINDNYGHGFGDSFIEKVAIIIKRYFNNHETFRIGGDEFVCIIKNTELYYIQSIITNIQEALKNEAIKIDDKNLITPEISIGIAYSKNNINIDELIKKADKDMEENKKIYYEENNIKRRK